MNPTRPDPRSEPDAHPVGRLLSLAGSRPELSPQAVLRLKSAVRPHWQASVRRNAWWRSWSWAVPLAAAAALAWTLGLRLLPPFRPLDSEPLAVLEGATGPILLLADNAHGAVPLSPGASLRGGDRLATGAGRGALRLANGASLRLDSGTRLRLTGPGRMTLESGAVYVDFESRGAPGIEIATSLGTIEELGTQFEVRLTTTSLRVRIREGGVVLHSERGSHEGRGGEQLTLGTGASLVRGSVPVYGEIWRWILDVAPGFDPEGRTLDAFLRHVGRELGREVEYATPELARLAATTMEIRGDIAGLDLEEALDYVLAACGVEHRMVDAALVVEPLGRP